MKLRFVEFSKKWNPETKKLVTAGSVYVIDGITKEELALYKGIKNVDGEDYYREENGKPKWFDREFYGFDCCEVKLFERADGTKGFKVVNTMVDALQVLAEQTEDPTEKARLLRESNMIKLSGKPYKASAVKADEIVDEEETEDETEEAEGL